MRSRRLSRRVTCPIGSPPAPAEMCKNDIPFPNQSPVRSHMRIVPQAERAQRTRLRQLDSINFAHVAMRMDGSDHFQT